MNSLEFRKWLAARGCAFEQHERGEGHGRVTVRLGDHRSEIPLLGSKKRLDPALIRKVKTDLGIAEEIAPPGWRRTRPGA
ncbi:MAG: type II toxin-antitoxin system HicA family toxin [Alphaproteobacteria bacterium]